MPRAPALSSFTNKWGSSSPIRCRSCGSPRITSLKMKSSLVGIGALLLKKRTGGSESQEKLCTWASWERGWIGVGESVTITDSPITRHLSFKDQRPRRAWRCSMPRAEGPSPLSRCPWTGHRMMQWRWGQRASSCSEQVSSSEGSPTRVVCSPHGSGSAAAPSGSPEAGISLKPRLPRPWPTPGDLDREGGKP